MPPRVTKPTAAPGSDGGGAPPPSASADGPTARVRALAAAALDGGTRQARGAGAPDDYLRAALRQTCDAARECGLRAEQLIVILKEEWRRDPEQRLRQRSDGDQALARVVTACIIEYYEPWRGR